MGSAAVKSRSPSVCPNSSSDASANSGAGLEDFLVILDEKLRQRNERLVRKLQAWGELLDVAGWCVALDWPGDGLWLSANAERVFLRAGDMPATWLDLMSRISAESIHHGGERFLIWSGESSLAAAPEPVVVLTRRESEVMAWLRLGKTGVEIAIILGCATRTVEKHLANLYRKLGVKNRTAVILNAPYSIG
jgi:DNA-binding CsgD family transcriptional regulator